MNPHPTLWQERARTWTLADGGSVSYVEGWLLPAEADETFAVLRDEVSWRSETITLFGKTVLQPRLISFMGDHGANYTYSGVEFSPTPWTAKAALLRSKVEDECRHSFNAALLNLYRDGQDSMGFHADDEPELGRDPVVASVSLGAARRFVIKPRRGGDFEPIRLDLSHGSLLVMGGTLQHNWLHGIPKTKRAVGPRINLTFRRIQTVEASPQSKRCAAGRSP